MEPGWLDVPIALVFFLVVAGGLLRLVCLAVTPGDRRPLLRGSAPARTDVPEGRPIEKVADEIRRLGPLVHRPPRGVSYAKYAGWCSAYDRALGEGCHALGREHLLGVLPPGEDLEAERRRVEALLWLAGMRIDEAA